MMPERPAVIERRDEAVQWLILDRDEYRNALSEELIAGLLHGLDRAEAHDDVRVVVIAANGSAFCAGAKLDMLTNRPEAIDARPYHKRALRLFRRILEFPKPTIAQVQGHALAGGAGVATCCDFVLCASDAELGYPEIAIAATPSMVMQVAMRRVPWRIALEWAMLGDRIDAEEARRWGLVNRVVPSDELDEATRSLAEKLAEKHPGAMQIIKELAVTGAGLPLERALRYASEMSAIAGSSTAARAAIDSFFASRASAGDGSGKEGRE